MITVLQKLQLAFTFAPHISCNEVSSLASLEERVFFPRIFYAMRFHSLQGSSARGRTTSLPWILDSQRGVCSSKRDVASKNDDPFVSIGNACIFLWISLNSERLFLSLAIVFWILCAASGYF